MANIFDVVTIPLLGRFLAKFKEDHAKMLIETQPDTIYDATSSDGVNYTATVPGVTSLYAGLKITVKLSRTSASTTPKLNVNGLGEKGIRQPLSNNSFATTVGASNTWLNAACPITLTYTGTLWKADFNRPSAASLYGTMEIDKGGTGADNAADALANLGAASTAYVDAKIAELQEQINALK